MKRLVLLCMIAGILLLTSGCHTAEEQPVLSGHTIWLNPKGVGEPSEDMAIAEAKKHVFAWEEDLEWLYEGIVKHADGSFAKVRLQTKKNDMIYEFYISGNEKVFIETQNGSLVPVGKPNLIVPLDEEFEEAWKLRKRFSFGWKKLGNEMPFYTDPYTHIEYQQLAGEQFTDYISFCSYLKTVFSESFVEQLMEKEPCKVISVDGMPYGRVGGRDTDITFLFVTYEKEESTENRLVMTQTAYYYQKENPSVLHVKSKPCILEKSGQDWVYDALNLYY